MGWCGKGAVGWGKATCNYVVIFSVKFQLRCRLLWHNLQLRCYLLFNYPTTSSTLVTQLATTLSALVTQLATTDVVFFSVEFQLHGWLLLVVVFRRGNGHFTWVCEPPCGIHAKSISQPGQACLSYCYYWCSMVCIKELHSQKFVLPKPWFTVVRKIMAMEVHKPQCQLAAEDGWSIEMHLLTFPSFPDSTQKKKTMKMSCYCGKTRKHPKFGIHFLDGFHERNSRFATVPTCFYERRDPERGLQSWFRPAKPETRNPKPTVKVGFELRNPKPETRNRLWRLNFPRTDRNPNPKPETRNPKPTLKT